MGQSTVLPRATIGLRAETFDPRNPEHIEAFVMITQQGRQHPSLRFTLEHPFLDVRSMMFDKIGRAYVGSFQQSRAGTVHV
jgi:hypothetical protein